MPPAMCMKPSIYTILLCLEFVLVSGAEISSCLSILPFVTSYDSIVTDLPLSKTRDETEVECRLVVF